MKRNTAKTPNLGWTSAQLIRLSQLLENAYGTGPLSADLTASLSKGDRSGWTTAQLLQLSAAQCL